MLRSTLLSLLILIFPMAGLSSAETEPRSDTSNRCPRISVVGPAGLTAPGEIARFELITDGELPAGVRFAWTVVNARVDEGQGTRSIGVKARREYMGMTITAIVKISGLPAGCPDSASEWLDILPFEPDAILLHKFSVPVDSISKTKLDEAARELSRFPTNQMYIIEYFPQATSLAMKERKLAKIRAYLKDTLNFDTSRVTIVTADLSADRRKPLTMIYRIPPGAENPVP